MKRTILGGLAISALLIGASVANAADMPLKAAPPPAPVNSWTGFYMDVEAGWQNDRYNWNWNATPPVTGAVPFSLSASSGSIGGHMGYQQQFGWLVVGGEFGAFESGTHKQASVAGTGAGSGLPCAITGAGFTCQTSIGSVSTAGGKLGVAWNDWLAYGVGGAAFGANLNSQTVSPLGVVAGQSAPQSDKGWYAGAGFDYMLLKTRLLDMLVGLEYEHVNLDSIQTFSSLDGFHPGGNQHTLSAKEDVVWAKLTVKWNPLGM